MHRGADRRRRLLLLGRTGPDTSTPDSQTAIADGADVPVDGADAAVDDPDVAFDASEFVSSHILAPDPGERFLAACRSNGHVPRLRVSPGGSLQPFDFEFRRPFALIGRSERCDLRFEHADVSYRHAYLQIVGGRLHCFDLASRTGTRGTDGTRVAGCVEDRATISVGPVTIENLDGDVHTSQDTSILLAGGGAAADGSLPSVYLEWMSGNGDGRPRTARLKRAVNLLGWSKSCHVRFARDQVSRVHASLVLTGAGVWIIDLLGRGGTLLDGKRIAFARLRDGADLQIGTFAFRLRLGEPPAPAAKKRPRRDRERDRSPGVVIHQNIVVGAPGTVAAPQVHTSTQANREALAAPPLPAVPSLPPAAAAPPAQSGLSEGFVLSLFGQFAEMQRAMFSQTQQQMTFMTQMLASLHQNQQELIREDLRRVHDINRELQLIQMQLFQQSAAGRAPGSASGPPYRLTSDAQGRPARPGEASVPDSGPSGFEDIVDVAFDFESAATSATSRAAGEYAPADEDDPSDVVPLPPDDPEHAAGPSSADPAAAQRPRGAVEQHAWLLDRMSRLERERNSRWHKIMGLLKGGRS